MPENQPLSATPTEETWFLTDLNPLAVRSEKTGGLVAICSIAADARLIAQAPELHALAQDLLAYERERFDGPPDEDLNVSGTDLVDWFTEHRNRVHSVVRRIEGKAARAPSPDPLHIQSLIADYGSAQYDCGEWTRDSDEPFEAVMKRSQDALLKLHAALGLRDPEPSTYTSTEHETALTVTFAPECNLQNFVSNLSVGSHTLAINGEDCRLQLLDTHFGLYVQPLDDDGNNVGGQKRIPWDNLSRIHVY